MIVVEGDIHHQTADGNHNAGLLVQGKDGIPVQRRHVRAATRDNIHPGEWAAVKIAEGIQRHVALMPGYHDCDEQRVGGCRPLPDFLGSFATTVSRQVVVGGGHDRDLQPGTTLKRRGRKR